MKLKLPSMVSSPQDLSALILEIHEYSRWLQHESIKRRANVKRKPVPPALTPAAEELLRGLHDSHGSASQHAVDDLIDILEHYKKSAPTITLTLAAPPTSGVKMNLVDWCRQNISPDVLVNFQFNQTLLGGMVVRSGSRVFDWSFRRQLLEARSKFPEVLRNV